MAQDGDVMATTINDERQVKGGRRRMGRNEQIAWDLVTTAWGSPTDPVVTLWDVTGTELEDVSATNLSGTASVAGDTITTPYVLGLTPGRLYRLEVQFTCSGNVFEPYVEIQAER